MTTTEDSIRVLHVDDQLSFAEMVAEQLEYENDRFTVQTAASASEGYDIVATHDIECIISDYEMPGQNGIEFLETVRSEYPDLPFILYTGKGSEAIASEAISAGVTDYLQKNRSSGQYAILANRVENAVNQYQTQRAVEESRERLSLFIDESLLGVIEWNEQLECIDMNDAAADILGYAPDEFVGNSWKTIVPESERDTVGDIIASLSESSGASRTVIENRTQNGERIICEWHNHVITDADGDIVTIFSQFQDITEQKQYEKAIENERDKFKTLFEQLPIPAVRITLEDGTPIVHDLNAAFEETFGYGETELENSNLDTYLAPNSLSQSADRINQQFIESGHTSERVCRQTAAGIREFRLDVVYLDSMTPPEGYATYLPLRTESAEDTGFAAHNTKVKTLHDVAAEIYTASDPETVYTLLVDAAEQILAFDLALADTIDGDELVPVAVTDQAEAYHETIPIGADDAIAAEVARSGDPDVTNDLTKRDCTPADPTYRSALTVPIDDHGIVQAVAREPDAFDETDQKLVSLLTTHAALALDRIEREQKLRDRTTELERQNERFEEFMRVVSHDLRSPLTVAQGHLEVVQDECDADRLAKIDDAHTRIETLITNLLRLAREGEPLSERTPVDLTQVIDASWRHVETADATLHVEVDYTVQADKSRLQQVFENLMRNAVEHGGDAVTVRIGALDDGFYIADDGPGIPPSDRDAVFEVGNSRVTDGTGFGLNIVKQIVEAHDWELTLTESATGGARFEVHGVDAVST